MFAQFDPAVDVLCSKLCCALSMPDCKGVEGVGGCLGLDLPHALLTFSFIY